MDWGGVVKRIMQKILVRLQVPQILFFDFVRVYDIWSG